VGVSRVGVIVVVTLRLATIVGFFWNQALRRWARGNRS
jgi:hypothetical protein